ncbi:MAG: hypothetical protein K6B52_09605 [Clostridiales bacterium]|nr:hypothetical protein [Clostridiales bacterium]
MKNLVLKLTALMLAVTGVFSLAFIKPSAVSDDQIPVVYMHGQGGYITADSTLNGEMIYPPTLDTGYFLNLAKKLSFPFVKGDLTGNWKDYGDVIYDEIYPLFEELSLDGNGNVKNSSGPMGRPTLSPQLLTPDSKSKLRYYYIYDWRLDPEDIVDDFNEYIQAVKAKTRSEKVNIVARCFAGNIVLSYFNKYGAQSVNDCIFSCCGFGGFKVFGSAFAGEFKFDAGTIDKFVNYFLSTSEYKDDQVFQALRYFVTLSRYSGLLTIVSNNVKRAMRGIHDDGLRRIARDTVGTMPSFWVYVGDEYYEKAKSYLFAGCEDEFAGLIEKIDYYHYNILNSWESILDKAESDGARIYNVSKYGFNNLPILGKNNTMSDSILDTAVSSFGATCSVFDGVLSDEQVKQANGKYISPDMQIDASTCRYPEHTWFVKYLDHRAMPASLDYLYEEIFAFDGYTGVDDLEDYPQYLVSIEYEEKLEIADKVNTDSSSHAPQKFFKVFFGFFKAIRQIIKDK